MCLRKGRQGCWLALKDLHGSLWGQPVCGSSKAVKSAAARALQRKAEWVSSLGRPAPAQRHLQKLNRKSKGLAPMLKAQKLPKAKTRNPGLESDVFMLLGIPIGTSSIQLLIMVEHTSGITQGNSAFTPPNSCCKPIIPALGMLKQGISFTSFWSTE